MMYQNKKQWRQIRAIRNQADQLKKELGEAEKCVQELEERFS